MTNKARAYALCLMTIIKSVSAAGILAIILLTSNFAHAAMQCDSCKGASGEAELCAPASTGGLEAVHFPSEFLCNTRASRNTLVSGYLRRDTDLGIIIFLMDREGDSMDADIKDMKESVAGVRSLHEGALMFLGERGTFTFGGQSRASHNLGFIWKDKDTDKDYVTAIWGIPMDHRMLKVWVTFPNSKRGALASVKSVLPEVEEIVGQICR